MSWIKIAAPICATLALAAFVWASESDELREKAKAMRHDANELAERGDGEEAENLEREALAMLKEADHLERYRPHRRDAETRKLQERLEELRLKERKLAEIGGENERLADVRREADSIERELHVLSPDGHRKHDDSPDDIRRRWQHMRIAMKHLHDAGLYKIAEHVAERAEATERKLHHHHDHPIHAIIKQLDELRHEVGRLRDEVNELKEIR